MRYIEDLLYDDYVMVEHDLESARVKTKPLFAINLTTDYFLDDETTKMIYAYNYLQKALHQKIFKELDELAKINKDSLYKEHTTCDMKKSEE